MASPDSRTLYESFLFPDIVRVLESIPKDKAVVTDSIGKFLPSRPGIQHHLLPGCTVISLIDKIHSGNLNLQGYKAILVHMGTNDIDPRTWAGNMTWNTKVDQVIQSYNTLISEIRRQNSHALLLFSSILPRPKDWDTSKEVVITTNNRLKALCKARKCWYVPSYSPFILKGASIDVAHKGNPIRHYFAHRDGGLHLTLPGSAVLSRVIIQALSDVELNKAAVARNVSVKFPSVRWGK